MKVKKLIEELQKIDPELTVCVYADHGQNNEYDNFLSGFYIEKNGCLFSLNELSGDDFEQNNLIPIVEISS